MSQYRKIEDPKSDIQITLTTEEAAAARRLLLQLLDNEMKADTAELPLYEIAGRIHNARRERRQFSADELFADPAWDMILSAFVNVRERLSRTGAQGGGWGVDRPERLIKLAEVSRRVGLGKSMIYDMIRTDRFPAPYKISPFASRWSEREIVAWIDEVKDGFEGKRRKV